MMVAIELAAMPTLKVPGADVIVSIFSFFYFLTVEWMLYPGVVYV